MPRQTHDRQDVQPDARAPEKLELYVIRYREGRATSPLESLIKAVDQQQADAIGQAYCQGTTIQRKFLSSRPAIVGGPWLLDEHTDRTAVA